MLCLDGYFPLYVFVFGVLPSIVYPWTVVSVGHSLIFLVCCDFYAFPRRLLLVPFFGWCGNQSLTKHCLPMEAGHCEKALVNINGMLDF